MELGIYSFAEINPNRATGAPGSAGERLRDLVEEIELADQVGLDASASASTTGPTTQSRRPPWSWAPPRRVPGTSASPAP